MEITSSKLRLKLSLVNLDNLRPHEQVIEPIVKSIAKEMLAAGSVRDPLMIDQRDHVILDGMHRFSALRSLKCPLAPCCLIDYDSSEIRVGSWFRLYRVDHANSLAEKLLVETQLQHSQQPIEPKNVNYDSCSIILTNDTDFRMQDLDALQRARIAVLLDRNLSKIGHSAEYLSDKTALQHLKSGAANFVIVVPTFTKDEIRASGLRGRLLPHKVTRHIIPSRPLQIDTPLELLRQSVDTVPEANRKMETLLSKRKIERKPPGSVFDGRRYEEQLLVFTLD